MPLFNVNPIYPRRAQERGTQGWAVVKFTISKSGSVEDAVAVEGFCGDPEGPQEEMRSCSIFNTASERAALKLKYKPRLLMVRPSLSLMYYIDLPLLWQRIKCQLIFNFL